MDYAIFQQIGVAVLLAALIGLEREHKYQQYHYENFAGLRTFALIGLLGALSYIIYGYMPVIAAVLTAGFLALVVASYVVSAKQKGGTGSTSEFASIIVFLLGVLSAMELYTLATAIALAVLTILYFKETLHKWAQRIRNEELVSTIQFVIITFVVLPLLPNQGYGPYEFFNPYLIWLMVVFISAISFASYIAIRLFGEKRGIGITGFLAGLISSTALTLSFAEESKRNRSIVNPYAFAVVIASSAMFFRIMLEVAVLNNELLKVVAVPLGVMGVLGLIGAAFLWVDHENVKAARKVSREAAAIKSPFNIWPALKFAVFFAVILFISKFALAVMGSRGLYLTSLLSGVMDVDAITVSVANLAHGDLEILVASIAVTIAAVTNTLAKGVFFLAFGNRQVAFRILTVFGIVLAGGVLSLLLI